MLTLRETLFRRHEQLVTLETCVSSLDDRNDRNGGGEGIDDFLKVSKDSQGMERCMTLVNDAALPHVVFLSLTAVLSTGLLCLMLCTHTLHQSTQEHNMNPYRQ